MGRLVDWGQSRRRRGIGGGRKRRLLAVLYPCGTLKLPKLTNARRCHSGAQLGIAYRGHGSRCHLRGRQSVARGEALDRPPGPRARRAGGRAPGERSRRSPSSRGGAAVESAPRCRSGAGAACRSGVVEPVVEAARGTCSGYRASCGGRPHHAAQPPLGASPWLVDPTWCCPSFARSWGLLAW